MGSTNPKEFVFSFEKFQMTFLSYLVFPPIITAVCMFHTMIAFFIGIVCLLVWLFYFHKYVHIENSRILLYPEQKVLYLEYSQQKISFDDIDEIEFLSPVRKGNFVVDSVKIVLKNNESICDVPIYSFKMLELLEQNNIKIDAHYEVSDNKPLLKFFNLFKSFKIHKVMNLIFIVLWLSINLILSISFLFEPL